MGATEASPRHRNILVLLPPLLLTSCSPGYEHFGGTAGSFASNGERIYFTGSSASGHAIIASGGSSMMSRHRRMPDMKHVDPNTVSLAPGEPGTLLWKFMGKDTVVFACNIPGHFEAGMKHILAISPSDDDKLASN